MCGICGELRWDQQSPDLNRIQRMMGRLARRGPDHAGHFVEGPVALGHQRLAVIDLSPQANQPMIDHALGLVLVFNGTIYNYPELRQQLQQQGYSFFSQGDSEVLLKAYHAWGAASVERLQGMFAFAIWDRKRQQLFLARDRLGIKPLYYSVLPDAIRFASTLPALLASGGINTQIDTVALHHQLTLHAVVPAPRTILSGVCKLPPAHTWLIHAETNKLPAPVRYWQLTARRPVSPFSAAEWVAGTHEALKKAVKRHLDIADVPVGVLLSGGLDSSLLVALLAEAGVSDLRTFSVGFEDAAEERGSEFEYSDQVVAHYGTCHQRYHLANTEVLPRLPEAVAAMSEPMVGQDAVAFYLLAEQVAQQVKVVQSGQGADEVFAGYFWYPQMQAATGSVLERFAPYYFDRTHAEFLTAVHPQYHGEDVTGQWVVQQLQQPGADSFMDQVLRLDITALIVDDPVKRVDNMTMAWGLEARVPFLDHELVEWAAQMPPTLKLCQQGKYPLKALARGLLPDSVIDRPKGYFPMPALKYVRGEFLEFMRDILDSSACRQRQLFQPAYLKQLLLQPEHYMTPLRGSQLWHAALLELWLQIQVDKLY